LFTRQHALANREVAVAVAKGAHRSNIARGLLAALVIAGAGFAVDGADADIIKKEDTLRGVATTRAQCSAIAQALWLTVYGQDFCVRYYLSTAGGEGPRPIVFWNGDSNGPVDVTRDRSGNITQTWHDPSKAFDVNTNDLMDIADSLSKMAKTAAIYIGRIGVEGTSGNHLSRKTLLELQLMNAALDALKQRYRLEGFHLAGESGGARIAFGLVGMRRDVGCVVSASGQLSAEVPFSQLSDPGKTYFQINAPAVAHNHAMRLIVVSDPKDQQVPPATDQTPMVVKLRQAGGIVLQSFAQSTDANHHGLLEYVRLVMAGCVLSRPDAEIVRAAATIVRRNTEINQRKDEAAKVHAPLAR
jgi:hypothetical protein